jgi:hypothetical protein
MPKTVTSLQKKLAAMLVEQRKGSMAPAGRFGQEVGRRGRGAEAVAALTESARLLRGDLNFVRSPDQK